MIVLLYKDVFGVPRIQSTVHPCEHTTRRRRPTTAVYTTTHSGTAVTTGRIEPYLYMTPVAQSTYGEKAMKRQDWDLNPESHTGTRFPGVRLTRFGHPGRR